MAPAWASRYRAASRSSTATSITSAPSIPSAACGGIAQAVETRPRSRPGSCTSASGAGVDVVLAGSIRDDGPLPEVITDTLVAQDRMREAIHGVGFALLIATALHSIATGNLLPASVKVVCVDINPATVTKLNDRGTFQTIGLVTDVEPFLRSLVAELTFSILIVVLASRDAEIERSVPRHPDVPAGLLRHRVRDQPLDERPGRQRCRARATAVERSSGRRSQSWASSVERWSRSRACPTWSSRPTPGSSISNLFFSSRFRFGVRQGEAEHFEALGAEPEFRGRPPAAGL